MNKALFLLAGLVVLLGVVLYFGQADNQGGPVGSNSALPQVADFNTNIASVSSKALVRAGAARVLAVRATNEAPSVRYFQLFNLATTSAGFSTGKTPELIITLPAASSTASPSITTLGSDFFSPAIAFRQGLVWTISSVEGSYASASVNPGKHDITVIYQAGSF